MGRRGPQHSVSYRVDGESRANMSTGYIAVEVIAALQNVSRAYGMSKSDCIENAIRMWLGQFSEDERLLGLKGLREKAKKYDTIIEDKFDESASPCPSEIDHVLEENGHKFFMTLGDVISVTGMTKKQIEETLTPVEVNDAGDIRYRRREVAAFVDAGCLFRS